MILVIAEQRAGALNRVTWETVAAAQQLVSGVPIKIAVFGSGIGPVASELASAQVAEVLVVDDPALASYTADGYAQAVEGVIGRTSPTWVLFPHTYQTRDLAPKVAAHLDRALITDCTAVRQAGGRPAFVRLMFQGKLMADVVPQGDPPYCATFQIGAFRADAAARGVSPAPVTAVQVPIDAGAIRQRPEAPFKEAKQAVDLTQAERIVAIGRGIRGQEHLSLAQELAAVLGAEMAASRPICDAGWLPMERQVGSSGQTVAPKLYIALGISGAIQHLVGMKGSRTIVAINKDAEAPIFEVADYGIAGDLFEYVPAVVTELKR
jgi:electron transfer flavoprotein alpha subunit